MKYALLALALVLAGCATATDRTYPTILEQCATGPNVFDADICDDSNSAHDD